jgi:cytoskeletal protein CcmA (bactofilin family)
MWKKDEELTETAHPQREVEQRPERSAPARSTGDLATIGRSISIHGEVTGDEDLLIQGRVEGSIDLKQHSVTVGPDGEVKASIVGRVVTVEGKVKGNLTADEQIILRSSASVDGDIAAPRVVLQDGARFRGGVDMGEGDKKDRSSGSPAPTSRIKSPEPKEESPELVEATSENGSSSSGDSTDSMK